MEDLDSVSSNETERSDNRSKPRAENLQDYEGSELVHGILSRSSSSDDSSASNYSRDYGLAHSMYVDSDDEGLEGVLQMGCMDILFLPNSSNEAKKSLVKINKKGDKELNLSIKGPLALGLESQMRMTSENRDPNATKSLSSVLKNTMGCRTPKGRMRTCTGKIVQNHKENHLIDIDHSLFLTEQSSNEEPESILFKSLMSLSQESSCDEDCDSNIIEKNFILPPPLPPFQMQASHIDSGMRQNYHNQQHYNRQEHDMLAPINYPYEMIVDSKVDPYHAKSQRNLSEKYRQCPSSETTSFSTAKTIEPPLIEKMPSQILVDKQNSFEAEESCLSYEVITAPDPPETFNPYRNSGPHNTVRYQEDLSISRFEQQPGSNSKAIVDHKMYNFQKDISPHIQVQDKPLQPPISKFGPPNEEKGSIYVTNNEEESDYSMVASDDSMIPENCGNLNDLQQLTSKAKVLRWRKANNQRLKHNLSLPRDEEARARQQSNGKTHIYNVESNTGKSRVINGNQNYDVREDENSSSCQRSSSSPEDEGNGSSADSNQAIAEEDLNAEKEDIITTGNNMKEFLQQPIDLESGNDNNEGITSNDVEGKTGIMASFVNNVSGPAKSTECNDYTKSIINRSIIKDPLMFDSIFNRRKQQRQAAKKTLKLDSDKHESAAQLSTISDTNDGILQSVSCTHDLNSHVKLIHDTTEVKSPRTPSVMKAAETAAVSVIETETALARNHYLMISNAVDKEVTENHVKAPANNNNNTVSKEKNVLKDNLPLASFEGEDVFPILTIASSIDTILSPVASAAVPMITSPRHSLSKATSPGGRKDCSSHLSMKATTTDLHDTDEAPLFASTSDDLSSRNKVEYGDTSNSSNIDVLYLRPAYTNEWHDTIQSLSGKVAITTLEKSSSGILNCKESTICTSSTEVFNADEFFEANMFNN